MVTHRAETVQFEKSIDNFSVAGSMVDLHTLSTEPDMAKFLTTQFPAALALSHARRNPFNFYGSSVGRSGMLIRSPWPLRLLRWHSADGHGWGLAEIDYAFGTLKADGIGVFASYGNRWLGNAAFDPMFAELNRRKATVFTIRSRRPAPRNSSPKSMIQRLRSAPIPLTRSQA